MNWKRLTPQRMKELEGLAQSLKDEYDRTQDPSKYCYYMHVRDVVKFYKDPFFVGEEEEP